MSPVWFFGIAFVSVVVTGILRRIFPESASLLPIVAVFLLLGSVLPLLSEILSALGNLGSRAGLAPDAMSPVLRGAGIGLITHFAAGICNDNGLRTLGDAVEYCGQISIVSLAVPLVLELANRITEMEF